MNRFFLLFLLFYISFFNAQVVKNSKVLIPYRVKNLWGLADTLGTIKVAPFCKEIKDFAIDYEQNFKSRYVVKTNKNYFVIDQDKKVLVPESNTYDSIRINKYHMDHFWVFKNGKTGLCYKGKEFIPCEYESITIEQNESYEVKKNELFGLVNSQGKLIIPIEYNYIRVLEEYDNEYKDQTKFGWKAKGILVNKIFYDTKIPLKKKKK